MLKFIQPVGSTPQLLKEALHTQGISLTMWRKIKRTGHITVNGTNHPIWQPIVAGDHICVECPEHMHITPEKLSLDICFEDEWLLVVNKPAGMAVHPSANHKNGTLANAVAYYYRQCGLDIAFHPIQRLDHNTSGLLLIAKNPIIQHMFAVKPTLISKTYLAIVSGLLTDNTGCITAPISRKPGSIIERTVAKDGQPAVTHFVVKQRLASATLAAIHLDTGRTHQIRVHFAYIGHPLLGDDLYGGSTELIARQALHAASLSFTHPMTQRIINTSCPLPIDMCALLS